MWMATVRTIFKSDTDPSPPEAPKSNRAFVFHILANLRRTAPIGPHSQFYAYQLGGGDTIPGTNSFGQNATFLTHVATSINGSHYGLISQWGFRPARLPRV